jgi:hypothetical protein
MDRLESQADPTDLKEISMFEAATGFGYEVVIYPGSRFAPLVAN